MVGKMILMVNLIGHVVEMVQHRVVHLLLVRIYHLYKDAIIILFYLKKI
jgi:hypothetical protein